MNQRFGHPAARAVAQIGKGVTFPPALAACGGGHIHVPGVACIEFYGLRFGSQPIEK
jgi:hypothetical protein